MAEEVIHAFVSAKSNSADATLVSANAWNDGHKFNGGINGQVLVYDNTQPNNMRWVDGPKAFSDVQNIANPTASPANSIVSIDFTSSSPVIVVMSATYIGITTVGAVNYTAEVIFDSTSFSAESVASGTSYFVHRVVNAGAGTHNMHVNLGSTGNVNFTGGIAYLTALVFGV